MSVSIHVTDPTPAECTALIAYLQNVAGIVVTERTEVRVGELSHSVTNVVNHHTTPAEDMTDASQASGKHAGIVDVPTEVLTEHYVAHFMDAPIVAIPSFMDAPVTPQFGASIADIPMVENCAVVDTAAIFGGTPERAVPPPAPAPVPFAHAATSGAELDIFNLPWDGRIHAATKAKLQDGSWRQRRGVAPALVVTVESELRGIMGVPTPIAHAAPSAPTVHVAPVPAHIAPPAPVVPAAANPFAAFMAFMTPLIVGKIITTPQLGSICVSLGLPHAGALAQRHDLIPAVQARVQAILDGGAA